MKRILKRVLALLLVALLVITGTPMASFAAETPSITNLVGTATGATSGEFTWTFNNPSGLTIESSSAKLNGDALATFNLDLGTKVLNGLDPKTDYKMEINVKYSTLSEENFTIKKSSKSTYETLTGILKFYSKQPTANDDTYSYYQNKRGNE